ncbi:hypothetical protein ACFTTN_14225 [Streptomyces niveus]|uniref:hypothetical protein n=1 Tax=Streptomyces niveus TaxID=193462 RepID=UPI003634F596
MTWNSRAGVVEALTAAGWAADKERPTEIVRHSSGTVWTVATPAGECRLDVGGGCAVFPDTAADAVAIAACLAASGQLRPEPTHHMSASALEARARMQIVGELLADATTSTEFNAVTRVALRAGLLWRCHPCKRNHYLQEERCLCGAPRSTGN